MREKIFITNKSSEIATYDQNNMNIIHNNCIIQSKQHASYHAVYVNKKNNHDVTRDVSYVLLEQKNVKAKKLTIKRVG